MYIMKKNTNIFFNAHHSPIGAFASFTLGFPGQSGGLGMELGKPADQNVYIGVETEQGGSYNALPFFRGFEDEIQRFGLEDALEKKAVISTWNPGQTKRIFSVSSDSWICPEMTFTIYSPVVSVPDPEGGDDEALKRAILPAVIAEMTIDNSQSSKPRKAFFGFQGNDPYCQMRQLKDTTDGTLQGIAQGRLYAIASDSRYVHTGLGFGIEDILCATRLENLNFGIGSVGSIVATIPAGAKETIRFAICFYRNGFATSGLDGAYYYTRYFKNIEAVAEYALQQFDELKHHALRVNQQFNKASLSDDQQFMLSHAIHSYYGSSQLLNIDGKPVWIINEGEYRMMNTLDLTADQMFFEITMNPWTVRNELDLFCDRYSYFDKVRFPGKDQEFPGGISFTHDMGVGNVFWRKGFSSYEQFGLKGCFSHMTCEELVNWILCGVAYIEHTHDTQWLKKRMGVFRDCFASLVNRDNPEPEKRNGVMSLDSSRCMGGSEITTYDSLDASLGQARNNVYLAVKTMAAYLALNRLFSNAGLDELSIQCRQQADRVAETLRQHVSPEGLLPAVIEENVNSRIIPVIEGLAFAWFCGCQKDLELDGCYREFLQMLKKHLLNVLHKGICLFEDNGWKISSTSDNSWLSKVYICQFVAREIFKIEWNESCNLADTAHVQWLLDPKLSYWCWSDQIIAGKITASKYYPRGVSSVLWLYENGNKPLM